jgi:hypothetical protein
MTVYDSLYSLLDHERPLFHCDEWRTKNSCSLIELFLNDVCLTNLYEESFTALSASMNSFL